MKLFIIITFLPIIIFANVKKASGHSTAKIKMSEAIIIAQSKSAGRLIESSLESENNFLIYNLTFSEPDKSFSEIKIDAGTGNILHINDFKTK